MDLVLYTNPASRGRIARWMLEEVEVPYAVQHIEYGAEMKSDAYRAINPMGKVPALRHGDIVVTETSAICAYLADAFPAAGLAPPLLQRATYYRWFFFAAGPFEHAAVDRAHGVVTPEDQRRMTGYGSFEAVRDTLETALSPGPYLCGERFTAADVYLGAHMAWGLEYDTIEQRPSFHGYVGRLRDRPARLRAFAADDATATHAAPDPP